MHTFTHPTYVRTHWIFELRCYLSCYSVCFDCLRVVSSSHTCMTYAYKVNSIELLLCYISFLSTIPQHSHSDRLVIILWHRSVGVAFIILVLYTYKHEIMFLRYSPLTSLHIWLRWMCFTAITTISQLYVYVCWHVFFFLHSFWFDTVKNAFDYMVPSLSVIFSISFSPT